MKCAIKRDQLRVSKSRCFVRLYRFIAVASTAQMESKYDKEKKKFLERLEQTEVPVKVETPPADEHVAYTNDTDDVEVIELKEIEGMQHLVKPSLFKSKRNLTLRQLRFANGVMKVLGDKEIVIGYQPLSNQVAHEIGEAPMDTKALKLFLQKLLTDGQIKVFKLMWPGFHQRYSVAFCPPYITATSPVIRAKCKEISIRAIHSKELQKTGVGQDGTQKLLSRYAYPRYVKIRKFHEFIIKMAYFSDVKSEKERKLPEGCQRLIDVIPHMTTEFVLGNINDFGSLVFPDYDQLQACLKMTLRDTPKSIYQQLVTSNSFRNAVRGNLRVLALFGLIQVIDQPLTLGFDGIIFYVNRRAKIVNTMGVWPRKDADIQFLEKEFYFDSMDAVYDFWNTVYQISSSTTISLETRTKTKINPIVRTLSEVYQYDDGQKLGDGMGPCGFDSGFYTDMPRLWRSLSVKINKQLPQPKVKAVKIPKVPRPKKEKVQKGKKKIPAAQPTPKPVQLTKEGSKIPKFRGKKNTESMMQWSETEDLIIMLCKAAITVMSPSSQPGCLRLRNITVKDILSINDPNKAQKDCHLRAMILENNCVRTYEKERILNAFKRNRKLTMKYEGMLKKLRVRFLTNISKYINEARLPMMEIVLIMYRMIQSQAHLKQVPCIAMNLDNLHKNYVISPTSVHKPFNTYKAHNDSDSEVALKETIMLTIALTYNRELPVNTAKKVYLLFKNYPEMTLRKAIDELRKSHAITAKEKTLNNKICKVNLQDLVESCYKLSAGYYRRWICKLNPDFFDEVSSALDQATPIEYIKGTPGLNCVCAELQASDNLEIVTAVSPSFTGFNQDSIVQDEQLNVVDIESKFKFKSGSITMKNKTQVKKYSELFEDDSVVNIMKDVSR